SERYGVKVIYGVEIICTDGVDSRCQTILVRNQVGLKNLYRLISKGHLEHLQKGRPIYPETTLKNYREGLLFGAGYGNRALFAALTADASEADMESIVRGYDYLEIQPAYCSRIRTESEGSASDEDIRSINRRIVALGKKYNKPVIATCNARFLDPGDEICRRIVSGSRDAKDDFSGGFYLRSTEEMLEEFSYLGTEKAYEVVVTNTVMIADMTEDLHPIPKGSHYPHLQGAEKALEAICENRFNKLYGTNPPAIAQKRFTDELEIILKHEYATVFMTAKRVVDKSESLGYHAWTRGLAGSSFVAYLLGITDIDPLKYGIPYEVLFGLCGDRVPDIDLKISPNVKKEASDVLKEIFGAENVFVAGTVGTLSEKTAYGYAKKYFDAHSISVSNDELNRIAQKCVGVLRATGQHPGGFMIIPEGYDVYDFTPIQHPTNRPDVITTHFDSTDLYGTILKTDVLEYDLLTEYKLFEEGTGVRVSDIPLDDADVFALFRTGDTHGLREFDTPTAAEILKKTQPKCFEELLKICGALHGTGTWHGNAEALMKNGTCELSDVVAVRDDIMLYLQKKGMDRKSAFYIMECVRKGKGLTAEQAQAMLNSGVPEWYVASCKKIGYLAPKAHVVACVIADLRLGWYKVHFPDVFRSVTGMHTER
ncbi:MAG: PHP domain-containing protein, partial [Clostridia bacterium]|nr:PHP domain-containing protein [Clostridia bacterium]